VCHTASCASRSRRRCPGSAPQTTHTWPRRRRYRRLPRWGRCRLLLGSFPGSRDHRTRRSRQRRRCGRCSWASMPVSCASSASSSVASWHQRAGDRSQGPWQAPAGCAGLGRSRSGGSGSRSDRWPCVTSRRTTSRLGCGLSYAKAYHQVHHADLVRSCVRWCRTERRPYLRTTAPSAMMTTARTDPARGRGGPGDADRGRLVSHRLNHRRAQLRPGVGCLVPRRSRRRPAQAIALMGARSRVQRTLRHSGIRTQHIADKSVAIPFDDQAGFKGVLDGHVLRAYLTKELRKLVHVCTGFL
jgi:hypothetical protein